MRRVLVNKVLRPSVTNHLAPPYADENDAKVEDERVRNQVKNRNEKWKEAQCQIPDFSDSENFSSPCFKQNAFQVEDTKTSDREWGILRSKFKTTFSNRKKELAYQFERSPQIQKFLLLQAKILMVWLAEVYPRLYSYFARRSQLNTSIQ
ncbi:hypothetical protein ACTXT7_009236 [Hymenolepis weldensis]